MYKSLLLLLFFIIQLFLLPAQASVKEPVGNLLMWQFAHKEANDTHVGFKGDFIVTDEKNQIDMQISGASWYVVWVDGKFFTEGPDRYHPDYPEYQLRNLKLSKGKHHLAIQVHYEGVDTRILKAIQPFLYCQLFQGKKEISVSWTCKQLTGYSNSVRRINDQFGWIEWLDTRKTQWDWQKADYTGSGWKVPVKVKRELKVFSPSRLAPVKTLMVEPKLIAEGKLAEVYGYEKDNPSARFFLRDLECRELPSMGAWRRYDLGKVRLTRPVFELDLPEGAVVEFAYSEYLSHGRVAPWINLSASDSYNLDHFVAKGGKQIFFPLIPKGGRFVEIHILGASEKIKFINETFWERGYHDKVQGSFTSNDDLLNKIWLAGVETHKSCAEDALVDNPTRERGQWLGDVATVGMQVGASAFSDLSLFRRGLIQSAQSAREDGMVGGLYPGGGGHLSSYAAQWVPACLSYWQFTGDKSILEELYPSAEKNIAAFEAQVTEWGVSPKAGWAFIDWGYISNSDSADMALNIYYYAALKGMITWSEVLKKPEKVKYYNDLAQKFSSIPVKWLAVNSTTEGFNWDKIGYHRAVLALKLGFISKEKRKAGIEFVKKHILNCFPNNPDAPRLSSPSANNPQLITPYFANFAFPVLIENGEMEFVLNQYRKCWGWMLEGGRTTLTEVFDTRWSHAHQWAGCPTWQLSRYVLGLHPSFNKGINHFDLNLIKGNLNEVAGDIPLPSGKVVHIKWKKTGSKINYEINTEEPISVNVPADLNASKNGLLAIKKSLNLVLEDRGY